LSGDLTRLTVRFGERDRVDGVPLADRLMNEFVEAGIESAVLMRGSEGFGRKHALRTADRLTLSEDLPMVALAVDSVSRIRPLATRVRSIVEEGLVTLEAAGPSVEGESGRMTVWTARQARIDGSAAHIGLIFLLKQIGLSAAMAMPGVDGVAGGVRHRAGFFSANRSVPMLVMGFGSRPALETAGEAVSRLLPGAVVETAASSTPVRLAGNGAWRLGVLGGGSTPGTGIRGQRELIRRLRAAGASGATAGFGLYGFAGEEDPHGDSLASLRRRVPVLTEVVDTAANCVGWMRDLRQLAGGGLVVEAVPVEVLSRPGGPA
jgi:PII-like signaling protein